MTYRIDLYGDITPDDHGVNAQNFQAELSKADGDDIELHVQSGGGDVFEGVAIMHALRDYPAEVVAIVEGVAASAASFVVVGGADRVVMQPSASLMIHEAWAATMGSARDMAKQARELERMTGIIAQVYADKAGTPVEEWLEAMEDESWFGAEEAVLVGLADEIKHPASSSTLNNRLGKSLVLNSGAVRYTSRDEAPTPKIVAKQRSDNTAKEDTMPFKEIAEVLGTDEKAVLNAFKSLINNETVEVTATAEVTYPEDVTIRPTENVKVAPVVVDSEGNLVPVTGLTYELGEVAEGYTAEVDENGVVSITAPASVEPGSTTTFTVNLVGEETVEVPLSVTVVAVSEEAVEEPGSEESFDSITLDRDTYNEMKAAAQFGWEAMENKKKEDQAAEVEKWIAEGRISAGLRAKALNAMTKDPEIARDLYGSNPVNTIPRSTVGHSQATPKSDSKVQELIAKADNMRGRK